MEYAVNFEDFYKELSKSIHSILKPYGFRKKGNKFFKISEDGFIKFVEIQKARFNYADESAFQIFCGFAIYDPTVAKDKLHEWCMFTTLYIGNKEISNYGNWNPGNYYCLFNEGVKHYLFVNAIRDIPTNLKRMVLEVIETKVVPIVTSLNTSCDYFYSKYFKFNINALDYLFELFGKDVLPYLQEQIDLYNQPLIVDHQQAQQLKEYYLKMYDKYSK